jgi:hypothetical protein
MFELKFIVLNSVKTDKKKLFLEDLYNGLASSTFLNLSWLKLVYYSITPINRTLFIRIANYPDRLDPSSNFVENCTKLICLEITGYRMDISLILSSKSVSQTCCYCTCTTSFFCLKSPPPPVVKYI